VEWGGEWEEKGKTVGWDKGTLTEWQRKRTVTMLLLIRRTYQTQGNSFNAQYPECS